MFQLQLLTGRDVFESWILVFLFENEKQDVCGVQNKYTQLETAFVINIVSHCCIHSRLK